jgi:SRSO17 transposase
MTEQQLRALGRRLNDFLNPYLFCCAYTQTFAHLRTYVTGLLSDLPRKSVEPIALRAGTPVRTLQQFLKDHDWSYTRLRQQLQCHAADLLPSLPADDLGVVGLLDETSAVKQGTKTPGVQRQYLGCRGKLENGIVTVHLGVCKGRFKTLVDADVFLPQVWSDDRPRCREAGIPDDVVYRPKWQIALEEIDRAQANGIPLDWLTFDEGYGQCPEFLRGLDDRHVPFVGEVPRNFSCLAAHRSGRRPDERLKGRDAEEVVRVSSSFRSQEWRVLRLARQTLQDQVWRVKAARVWVSSATGWSAGTYWLIWASNDETGEEKFFLSNAPAETPVDVLMRVGFRRANVEHGFRLCKTELGFTHFEGRNYVALMRHMTLCLTAMTFVAEHTERLRGEKSGDHHGAGLPRPGGTVPRPPAPTAAHERPSTSLGGPRLSPGTQPPGTRVQAETPCHNPDSQEAAPTPKKTPKTPKTIYGTFNVAL